MALSDNPHVSGSWRANLNHFLPKTNLQNIISKKLWNSLGKVGDLLRPDYAAHFQGSTIKLNNYNEQISYFKKYAEDNKITNIIIATTWWHDQLYDGEKFVYDKEHILLAKSLLQLVNKLNSLGKTVYLVGPIQVPLYELPQDLSRLLKFNHIIIIIDTHINMAKFKGVVADDLVYTLLKKNGHECP